jgi:hypothetical protein
LAPATIVAHEGETLTVGREHGLARIIDDDT